MKVEVEEILHMVGGLEETSYATNSRIQEKAISTAQPTVESLAVADLGCSSGPTTFMVISNVMATLSNICSKVGHHPPEIMFFLNDLPGNDFNTIFKSLTCYKKKQVRGEEGTNVLPYYVVGAPGSFYGRLFPKESIHFVHSSYSLHWLSQIPQGLENYGGVPLNRGNIYIAQTSPPGVVEAYLQQFQQDFSTFLKLRAEEIINGGQMVLTILGRTSADPLEGEMTHLLKLLNDALNSIVSEGLIGKAKLDEFDLPFYAPSMEEVRAVVTNQGSFDLQREYVFELNWDPYDNYSGDYVHNNKLSGENAAKCVRAALEPILASQFGEAIMDTLFSRYAENVAEHLLKQKTKLINFTIALKKRG